MVRGNEVVELVGLRGNRSCLSVLQTWALMLRADERVMLMEG